MTCRVLVNRPDAFLVVCGPSSPTCECRCPTSCGHDWSGPTRRHADGYGFSSTCAKCGMDAMDHDLRVLP